MRGRADRRRRLRASHMWKGGQGKAAARKHGSRKAIPLLLHASQAGGEAEATVVRKLKDSMFHNIDELNDVLELRANAEAVQSAEKLKLALTEQLERCPGSLVVFRDAERMDPVVLESSLKPWIHEGCQAAGLCAPEALARPACVIPATRQGQGSVWPEW